MAGGDVVEARSGVEVDAVGLDMKGLRGRWGNRGGDGDVYGGPGAGKGGWRSGAIVHVGCDGDVVQLELATNETS